MSKVNYEFILFGSPRAQSGVVIAYPPEDCHIRPMLVAYADELSGANPTVFVCTGMTTLGLLKGIVSAVQGAQYGMFLHMMDKFRSFSYVAYDLDIGIDPDKVDYESQIDCKDLSILNYVKDELMEYENE